MSASAQRSLRGTESRLRAFHPLRYAAAFQRTSGLGTPFLGGDDRLPYATCLQTRWDRRFSVWLFPFRSPLLWESHSVSIPPLNDMLKFGGYAHPIPGRRTVRFTRHRSTVPGFRSQVQPRHHGRGGTSRTPRHMAWRWPRFPGDRTATGQSHLPSTSQLPGLDGGNSVETRRSPGRNYPVASSVASHPVVKPGDSKILRYSFRGHAPCREGETRFGS